MNLDRYITRMDGEPDGDLIQCDGIAYQADRSHLVKYDDAYFGKCAGYEGQSIAVEINAGRVDFVWRNYGDGVLVDVGIGSGEFIRTRGGKTMGCDVNPMAVTWLRGCGRLFPDGERFPAASFWDVIEHVPDPGAYLDRVMLHGIAFFSIPVFTDLRRVRESKHYRPGEHLTYWTHDGFVRWMAMHGFRMVDNDDFETRAGRESIRSYAFRRYRWPIESSSS